MPQKANNLVSVDRAIVARYQKEGHKFEILVDPDLAWDFREGDNISIDDIIASYEIYRDSKKAERASEEIVEQIFKTNDIKKIAEFILKEGEIQLTTEHRRKILDKKRKKIITYIARHSINPKTKKPHTPKRVEKAMESAKINIDINQKIDDQAKDIVKKIMPLLPIRLEKTEIAIRLEGTLAGKAYPIIQSSGKLKKEEWASDGYWIGIVEIPAGTIDEFIAKLDSLTKGNVETKVLGR